MDAVAREIGAKDLRFGDEETLYQLLGVKQGCVTIFAMLNDSEHIVQPILDSQITTAGAKFVNFHPMTNSATMGVSPQDLLKFLQLTGHKEILIDL